MQWDVLVNQKSAIMDHVNKESRVINWDKATIIACGYTLDQES